MTGPTEAWERGEQRRTRTIGLLAGAVALLAVAVLSLAALALDQRSQLTDLDRQSKHQDQVLSRVECLIEKQARVLVLIVVAIVEDDPESATAVIAANDDLNAALDGVCHDEGVKP